MFILTGMPPLVLSNLAFLHTGRRFRVRPLSGSSYVDGGGSHCAVQH